MTPERDRDPADLPVRARFTMHERDLRTVLLIQAIEESDRDGEVLPLADRAEATRAVLRSDAGLRDSAVAEASAGTKLGPATGRFLHLRAQRLFDRLRMRSPGVTRLLALAGGTTWLARAVLVLAFVSGTMLSALDGSRRIDILAFPLIGVIAWNLLVYLALLVGALRRRAGASGLPHLALGYEKWIRWRAESLLRHSSAFNAPLADALRRFAIDWSTIAHPLLVLRAKRLLHLAAALVPLGLIGGLYVRGIALQYEASWESTFLGPESVRTLLGVLYGPASVLSGIALPDTPEAILRLRRDAGGGEAAPWIHLIALTAVLYVVLPRALLALWATLRLWRRARSVPPPGALALHARALLLGAGDGLRAIAAAIPYAYEPGREAVRGLESLLSAAFGGTVKVDLRDPVRYGDEETFAERLAHGAARIADGYVLVMNLASTPEPENHGVVLAAMRDGLAGASSGAPLLVVVDESVYAARLRGDETLSKRLEERRALWRQFVADHGLRACIVDLARLPSDEAQERRVRDEARAALWRADERAVAR